AKDGSRWKKNRDKVVNFPRNVLLERSWAWHYFISAKLLPSTHVSDVSKERAILNYAIQKQLSLNVGKIIEQTIIGFAIGRLASALGHPSLICQLCERVGVVYTENEEIQIPLPIIDWSVMRSWRTAQSSVPHATN
ncbi:hypothetical protein, partial [Escherichia coli]|uniref:hypothetical protein n=1 Tax=Escherichia coli TaxID=562 RepID=UPI003341DC4C